MRILRIFYRRHRQVASIAALAALFTLAAVPVGTLQGQWKLVEQRRGEKTANNAPVDSPVRLEFLILGGKLQGRIWAGEDRDASQPWPAMMADNGPVRVELKDLSIDSRTQRARASYVVKPSGTGGETLEVVEAYALADDGRSLAGTVTVTDTTSRGSYTLYRRFARER
ncbi:MAG TPA: hypothetical protein VFW45_06585 [Candidatus Polarisedimenticolia bacterium]|nr:hypothetical protein [Candidatus Polarisedimenticolia bacterium]